MQPSLETEFGNLVEISGASAVDNYAAGGAWGCMLHPLARGELEFSYRENDIDEYHVMEFDGGILDSQSSTPAFGQIQGLAGMVNFLAHTDARRIGCCSLYGGGGIGLLWVDGGFSTAQETFTVSDASFAYQFIAGGNYVLSERLDAFVEYRYLGADYIEVQNATSGIPMGDHSYDSHGVFMGFRFGR